MIIDEDVVLVKNNVEDETSQLIATNWHDDMSFLTVDDKTNIYNEYFDTPNSKNYLKKNFWRNEKGKWSPVFSMISIM